MNKYENSPEDNRDILDKLDDASIAVVDKVESAFDSVLDLAEKSGDKAMDLVDAIEDKIGDSWVMHQILLRDARVGIIEAYNVDLTKDSDEELIKRKEHALTMIDGWKAEADHVRSLEGNPDFSEKEIQQGIELKEAHIDAEQADLDAVVSELEKRGLM